MSDYSAFFLMKPEDVKRYAVDVLHFFQPEEETDCVEIGDGKVGVITASISYQYAKEVFPEDASFLKLGLTFPLPMDLIRDFASRVEKLYVIEELDPFMEDEIKAAEEEGAVSGPVDLAVLQGK